jgi:hypothetical protein
MNLKATKMSESKFYWDSDTLDYFSELTIRKTNFEVKKAIEEFVKLDCNLEEGETEEMLINDLVKQVYNK